MLTLQKMASVALNALSVVSGIVTIVGFIQSNLPDGPDPIGAKMRVAVGLDGNGLSEAGGDRPYVVGFNEVGDAIGLTEGGDKIGSGSFAEMVLDQNAAGTDATGQQATYLQITPSGDDGICIAYVSITWMDGLKRAWMGDMGEACGYKWYVEVSCLCVLLSHASSGLLPTSSSVMTVARLAALGWTKTTLKTLGSVASRSTLRTS